MPEVQPLPGARDLLETLHAHGHTIVLASSAKPDELQHYIALLDAHEIVDGWTDSGDVERTKPEPDLVQAAVEKAGGGPAVMIGDSVWDAEAAGRAGLQTIGVLTGGFSEQELTDAGADLVFRSLPELTERLGETPLG
jgi:HAD superfamily hydrolase (TIGR01509 family)